MTAELGIAALTISVTLALLVGTLSAVKRNSAVDLLASGATLMGVAFPSFFLGIILILLFASAVPGRIFPPGRFPFAHVDPDLPTEIPQPALRTCAKRCSSRERAFSASP